MDERAGPTVAEAGKRRVYLDNAATSYPKPPEVLEAMCDFARRLGASAGRGAYAEALEAGDLLAACRREINGLVNGERDRHVVFALNCTDALNLALRGLIDPFSPGHALCTALDHNSVLRPIHAMAQQWGLAFDIVPVDPATSVVDPDAVRRALRPDTKFVVVPHASNVTGALQPVGEIGRICREAEVTFVVDAAQSLGHVPVDVQAEMIDLLAASGHKGLLGPHGTGLLYIRPGLEARLRPLREGGTGSRSHEPMQPEDLPERYEAGTHNVIGIAGLLAGVRWVRRQGPGAIAEHERALTRVFLSEIAGVESMTVFGPQEPTARTGVVSIRLKGLEPQELSAALETGYGVLTRSGVHCAPLAHKALGTLEAGGTTRFSFGPFIAEPDVRHAAAAVREIAASLVAR